MSFQSRSGVWLDGLLYEAADARGTVLHVHGSCGNFYTNQWLRPMAAAYVEANYNFLAFNLTAHDGLAQAYRDVDDGHQVMLYVGFSVSEFATAFDDIEGAVAAAWRFSKNPVILQGHSLGCDRIVAYQRITGSHFPSILLSPADSIELRRRFLERRAKYSGAIDETPDSPFPDPFSWLPIESFGIDEDESYYLPTTKRALKSLFLDSRDYLFGFGSGANYRVDSDAFVFVGANDGYKLQEAEEVFGFFEARFRSVEREYRSDSGHQLTSCAEDVTRRICSWLSRVSRRES